MEAGGMRGERQERLTQQRVASPRRQSASALLPADMLVFAPFAPQAVWRGEGEKGRKIETGNCVESKWPLAENTSRRKIPSHAGA